MRMMALSFEIQHGIDNVLEGLGPGQAAVLRHVTDEEGRDVLTFRHKQQLRRGLAHLPDAPRRGLEFQREDRLHGVDDYEGRFDAGDLLQNPLEARLSEQIQRSIAHGQALAARLDLMFGFFPRAVEHRSGGSRHVGGCLQEQRRLADARLPAEQDERTGHDAAAEHAIEFDDASRETGMSFELNLGVQPRRSRLTRACVPVGRRRGALGRLRVLLDQRIPSSTIGAPPQPLRGLRAAVLTDKDSPWGFHGVGWVG